MRLSMSCRPPCLGICACVKRVISLSRHTFGFCGLSASGCLSLTCLERCDCHLNFSPQCWHSNRLSALCTVMCRLRSDLHPNVLGHFLHLNLYEKCFLWTCLLCEFLEMYLLQCVQSLYILLSLRISSGIRTQSCSRCVFRWQNLQSTSCLLWQVEQMPSRRSCGRMPLAHMWHFDFNLRTRTPLCVTRTVQFPKRSRSSLRLRVCVGLCNPLVTVTSSGEYNFETSKKSPWVSTWSFGKAARSCSMVVHSFRGFWWNPT